MKNVRHTSWGLRDALTHHLHIGDETETQRDKVSSPGSQSHPETEPGLDLGADSQPRALCPTPQLWLITMRPTLWAAYCLVQAQAVLSVLCVLTHLVLIATLKGDTCTINIPVSPDEN